MKTFRCWLANWLWAWVDILDNLIYIITLGKIDTIENFGGLGFYYGEYIFDRICGYE